MYIIAGLGNPGKEYENTRHNIGFDVIDRLAEEENIAVMESKHKALIGIFGEDTFGVGKRETGEQLIL